jgi:hypothetical protein
MREAEICLPERIKMRVYTDLENFVSIVLGVVLGVIAFVVRNCL